MTLCDADLNDGIVKLPRCENEAQGVALHKDAIGYCSTELNFINCARIHVRFTKEASNLQSVDSVRFGCFE